MKELLLEILMKYKIKKTLKKEFPHKRFHFAEIVDIFGNYPRKCVFYKDVELFQYVDSNYQYLTWDKVRNRIDINEIAEHIETQDMLEKAEKEKTKKLFSSWLRRESE